MSWQYGPLELQEEHRASTEKDVFVEIVGFPATTVVQPCAQWVGEKTTVHTILPLLLLLLLLFRPTKKSSGKESRLGQAVLSPFHEPAFSLC